MKVYYVAKFEPSGESLFSSLSDAKEWANYQFGFHFPGVDVRWVDGGEHGWYAHRWEGYPYGPDGVKIEGASISAMMLDRDLPEWRKNG